MRMASQTESGEFEAEALPHRNDLFRAAVRLLLDRSEAGNAVQQTFLIAWKSLDRNESRTTNYRVWLFQILWNVVRKKRRKWFKWITGKDEDLAQAQLIVPKPIPESLTDRDLLAALDELPIHFREALLLVDVEEFSYKEASEILQVPVETVISRLNRARGLLSGQLTGLNRSYGLSSANA